MWQLVINGPGYFDTAYDLPDGVTTLGRAEENDIVLSGDLVSRRHARFHVHGDELKVEDLGSRNGSRINGQPLHGTVALKVGDTVNVGENALCVRQPASAEAAETEMVDLGGGGVKRVERGDVASAVILSKDVRDSVLLKALDNVTPSFQPAALPFEQSEGKLIGYASLFLLYKTAEKLSTAPSLQSFLEETTDRLLERVGATTAVVLLRHASGVLAPAAVRHRGELQQGEVPVSDAIIDAALKKGAALAVAGVREDERFASRESVILYGADQVFCVPIGHSEPYSGVLYLNKSRRAEEDLEQLLDLCTAVAHLVAVGVEKFQLRDRGPSEERLRHALERFHAPDAVQQRLAELSRKGAKPTQMEDRAATVLFADIFGFSALVQKLSPERVVEILNEFHQRVSAIVFSFGGTVASFAGDGAMALFGAPYGKGDDALRAVRAALALKAEWQKTSAKRPPRERSELKLGLNTGKVLAGTVGHEGNLDFTAVGEPVNVAAWVCQSASSGQVLITGKTLANVGARFDVTPLGERSLCGDRCRSAVFEVLEEDPGASTKPGDK
ncbi:MAG: FHA domain-containing protein [Myxococcales bacterium]|nr:FHA domain-containing protein [Myxococcales bacterium]